jgi:hypothetical protein
MAKLRIYQAEVAGQPGSRVRVYEVTVLVGTDARPPARLRVALVSLSGVPIVLPVTSNQTVESQAVVTLSATMAGTVTAWSWTQTAGPAVVLTGTGDTRTFPAPADKDGLLLAFAVRATVDGYQSPPVTANVAVRPHQWWTFRGGAWQPCAPIQIVA